MIRLELDMLETQYPTHDIKLEPSGQQFKYPKSSMLYDESTKNDAFIGQGSVLRAEQAVTPLDIRTSDGRRETDPNGTDAHEPGAKLDSGKLQPWLFFSGFAHALEKVAEVTTIGANKYTPNGWVTVPEGPRRYMEAYQRHALKLGQGQVYDTDPGGIGTKHIAQMIWNLLAVLELEERNDKSNSK